MEWIQNGEKHNGEITKRRTYKTAKTKRRLLQNGEYTKRRLLQNGDYYKTAIIQNDDCYKTANHLKKNGESYKIDKKLILS